MSELTNDELRRLAEAAKPQCDYHPNMTYEAVERSPDDEHYVEAVILFDDNDYAAEVYGHMAYDVDGMALAKYWAAASPDAVLELLDENDRLREVVDNTVDERDTAQLRAETLVAECQQYLGLLKLCEWSGYGEFCPLCHRLKHDGHAPDCELAQALRGEG